MACHLSLEPLKGGTPGSAMQTKARFRTSILKSAHRLSILVLGPLGPSSLLAPGPTASPGGITRGSGEISRLDDKQRPKDERVLMSPFRGTKAAGILNNTSPAPPGSTPGWAGVR